MRHDTDEFSFRLQPATIPGAGVGVFCTHDIAKGTFLRLFGRDELSDDEELTTVASIRPKDAVPDMFIPYTIHTAEFLICPKDFGHMFVASYLNHSATPNTFFRKYNWYALRDLQAGEELLIDYNTLGEPQDAKEDYYL